jgi:DNA processing protein
MAAGPAFDDDVLSWLKLGLVPGLGPGAFRLLLKTLGSPSAILAAGIESLARVVPRPLAEQLRTGPPADAMERALQWLAEENHTLVTLADACYPAQLLEIADPPPLLYVEGDVSLLSAASLAMVGSRNATPQGLANAHAFARRLSDSGYTIISGLALGIDAASHRGALEGSGSTIAVLGTGVDNIYPRANSSLAAEIASRGALVSEFPLHAPPLREHFPRRNRIISGLARGCLVVEAAMSSGSLITARVAAEQGREVFAMPGSIHSPVSRGCHSLIKQGAKLVESVEDVLAELGGAIVGATPLAAEPNLSQSQDALLQHVGHDACALDTLIERSGLTPAAVSAMLLQLELEGRVGSLPGGLYQRIS